MLNLRLAVIMLPSVASPALGGNLNVSIVDTNGRPVSDAVVSVRPAGGIPSGPIRFPWGTSMVQQDISFQPHVLIVPVGTTVRFLNNDHVRHHIYSFSKSAAFEIKLFGKNESRRHIFTTQGTVALGCNIHDHMSGFIRVVNTPFAAKSDSVGQISIDGLASGTAQVTVWHPLLKAKHNEVVINIPIPGRDTARRTVSIPLRSAK